jgi:phosphoesterase RecJ-like protein
MTRPTTDPSATADALRAICGEVQNGRRFLITSHARPDGDSIGSQLAVALALDSLGKEVRIVNRDAPPAFYDALPGIARIEIADRVEGAFDAGFVMECSDIDRPGLAGLDRQRLINIDHHLGNTSYGAVNWFDETAAACGEMVSDLIDALGVPFSREIGTHLYLAILTDTGSFRHSNITARTFDICRRAAEAGVVAADVARTVYDNSHIGRLKLMGTLLDEMGLEADGRIAVLSMDDALLRRTGCDAHDGDGLINLPLSARSVQAVVFLKPQPDGSTIRVSLRSKDDVDVRAVALKFGGGGHKNASGFTTHGSVADVHRAVLEHVAQALQVASLD